MSSLSELNKQNGVVYTPSNLANYIGLKLIEYSFQYLTLGAGPHREGQTLNFPNLTNLRMIDPACGHGELLLALWDAFCNQLAIAYGNLASYLAPDPREVLCGIDIDEEASRTTQRRIKSISHTNVETRTNNILRTNALYPFNKASSQKGWEIAMNRFRAIEGFDILIANPPWGADTEAYDNRLSKGEFVLYKGQFDTSDLFVELALRIVKPGGYFAFIVPDSLFNGERSLLRRILLEKTEIKYVGRFGEKIFPNINRACAVLICRKNIPSHMTSVDCFRLTPELRKGILLKQSTFKDAEIRLLHQVPQSRFATNKDYLFDIYLKENEKDVLEILRSSKSTFREHLENARGVELAKSGQIAKCNHCGMWIPYPSARNPQCAHCKSRLALDEVESSFIINNREQEGYEPILVGEDINRYRIASCHWICPNKLGINYKNRDIYRSPKIVVRKTGVGLLAAMDYQSLMTNQVVYIFKCKHPDGNMLPIEFFLAVMNSRAIYYYLVKTSGETEWRSHPYLTQNQILDLPLPHSDVGTKQTSETINQIVTLTKPYLMGRAGLSPKVDAEVEYLVSKLYGLSRKHYKYIYDTLMDVEQLLPVKSLGVVSINDIFG